MERAQQLERIEPGMVVETTRGDLGEQDISKPRVKEVIRNRQGNAAKVVVEKGLIFRKDIEVPADRIVDVAPAAADAGTKAQQGEVTLDVQEPEIEQLRPTGTETLTPEAPERRSPDAEDDDSLLGNLEERMPTAEGLRRREGARRHAQDSATEDASEADASASQATQQKSRFSLRDLGPGFLAGMSGNDATAVTSYAVVGASVGYGLLWLMLLATPMYQSVQYACGKIGRVTAQGIEVNLRERYGRKVALPTAILLCIANITLITGDLVAIGSGLQLITGLDWVWFVVPVAALLWYLTVFESFDKIKKIFMVLSFAFVAYLVTGLVSGANWGAVLASTFVPRLGFDFASISAAVGLLGATLSPYSMVWQAHGETEEQCTGTMKQQRRKMSLDIAAGTIGGNLVSYFIIVCTAATLFAHHQQITTAADAARALEPLLGPAAKYLFAVGLLGAGVVAIPILMASTSYALAGAFGWSASLWRKPWQSEGFYLIMTASLLVSIVVALLRFNPIQLIFYANMVQGVLAPVLITLILLLGNSRKVMRDNRFGWLTNFWLVLSVLVTVAGTLLLCYGLFTGH